MITIKKINEVHLTITSDDFSVLQEINDYFSFFMDGYRFSPKYKARIWDGKIRLFNYSKRLLYIGLLPHLLKFCELEGVDYVMDKSLENHSDVSPNDIKEFIDGLNLGINNKPILPRAHQYMGLYHIVKNKRACLLSPTSSGKSLIVYCSTRYILNSDIDAKKVLIVVPTVSLVTQMYKDFIDYSCLNNWDVENNVHTVSSGIEKSTDKPVTISTWQSIAKMPPSFFDGFGTLMYDEAHLLKGQSLQNIADKCVNSSYRVGYTGTLNGAKANTLVIEGVTGKVKSLITTKQLMDKGEIAKLKINVEIIKYPDYMCKGARQLDYQSEVKAIAGFTERNKVVCDMATEQKRNTLVLFNTKAHGKNLFEILQKSIEPSRNVYYIDGDTHKDKREEIRVQLEIDKDSILVASYGTLSTGISIKNLHTIIFASSSKSKIRVLQSIGRGLRLHKDKTHMVLIDVVDDMSWKKRRNYSVEHFIERQNHYNTSGFDYSINTRNLSVKI